MKKITNICLILISGIILGFLLMILTYCLPTDAIKENVKESVYTFIKEGTYYRVVSGYESSQLDNYTDAIMLSNAFYDGNEDIINKAIQVYRYTNNSEEYPTNQLVDFFMEQNMEWEKTSYSRYWHGYLVFLKPILLFFDYSDIRMINQVIQTLLIAFIIMLSIKRGLKQLVVPFIIAILSIVPSTIALSLQFSTTFYISLLSIIVILLFYEKLKNKEIYLFLIIGMVTSFFDFLTSPILTFGMPLVYLIVLNQNDWKKDLKNIVVLTIMWGIGYIGMWAGKWIITCIVLQENVMTMVFDKIVERASGKTSVGNFNRLDMLNYNLNMIKTASNSIIFSAYLVYIICKAIKQKIWEKENEYIKAIPFFMIAIIPLMWYIFASNHSYVHYWFTYRNLAVTIFSILIGITIALFKIEPKSIKNT